MKIKVKKTARITHTVEFDSEEIINFLNDSRPREDRVPTDATVSIKVPSGGDYSGMTLEDFTVTVSWVTEEVDG